MSNAIALLQAIGQDSSLIQALRGGDDAVLRESDLAADVRTALLAGDPMRLATLLGAPAIVCCVLEKQDDDEDQGEDIPVQEDNKVRAELSAVRN